jgi:hypothetical protein
VERENKKKRASVNDLATSQATTLWSEERKKLQHSARMICDQLEKEFNAHKTEVALSANTVNRYVREGKFVVEYGFATLTKRQEGALLTRTTMTHCLY